MQTTYSKGQAKSYTETDPQGNLWIITTSKNDRTGAVECSALQAQNNGGMISYELFGANRLKLASEQGNAIQSRIERIHNLGLAEFEKQYQAMPKAKAIEIGQVLFSIYDHARQSDRAVWAISSPGHYETVLLDGSELRKDERVKEYAPGTMAIGTYFTPGEVIPVEEVEELKAKAIKARQEKEEAQEREHKAKEEERYNKIIAGAKIISEIPSWAQTVIEGRLERNTSDPTTDYFASATDKVVYLAFSPHKRDLFAELREAAKACPETESLAQAPIEWEHREKYSMGAGYYLGQYRYSGWQIQKHCLTSLQELQIAAAEGRFFCKLDQTDHNQSGQFEGGIKVKLNPQHQGIEIYFDSKPSADQLSDLKANGWRWAKFNKCWYRKDSPSARKYAERYGFKNDAPGMDADLVTAQENAAIDRFVVEGD